MSLLLRHKNLFRDLYGLKLRASLKTLLFLSFGEDLKVRSKKKRGFSDALVLPGGWVW